MSKEYKKRWYYCILAYIDRIDKSNEKPKIYFNENIEYTFVYTYDNESIYYDIRTSKNISFLNNDTAKENNWYIISAIELDVDLKGMSNYNLRKLINFLPRLEEKVKTINKVIKKRH